MLWCALLAAPSPHLSEGIRLYKAQNYSEALAAFTHAIDEPNSSRDKARIHVYIGLIQFRFSMRNDASASFERALDYDSKLELSKKHNAGARKLFAKIKRDRFGDDRPVIKKKGRRSKRSHDDPPGSEAKLDSEPDPVLEPPPPPPPPPPSESTIAVAPPPPPEAAPPPALAPPPPPPPAIAPPVTATTEPARSSLTIPAWVSMGVGAASLVVALSLGGVSIYNFSTAPDEPFAIESERKFNAAVGQRTGAIVAGSIGIVGLGVGTTLLLIE
jgi:hypothetical protein